MLSSFLHEDTLSFPMELICVELGYLIASVSFEVTQNNDCQMSFLSF